MPLLMMPAQRMEGSAAMKPDIVGCSKSIMLVKAMMEPKKNCIIESSMPFTFVTNREITRM